MTINTDREIVAEGENFHIRKTVGRYQILKTTKESEFAGLTTFSVFEFTSSGVPFYTNGNGDARPSIKVEVTHPYVKYAELSPAEVDWPSTSDKRPALAYELAQALTLAVVEAERLNAKVGL